MPTTRKTAANLARGTRKTAANLAREMMPGPRPYVVRPTVSRFTLRKPEPTVAPRKNQTVKMRKTAANTAKYIRNLPTHIKTFKNSIIRHNEFAKKFRNNMKDLPNKYKTLGPSMASSQFSHARKMEKSYRDMATTGRKTLAMLEQFQEKIKPRGLTLRTIAENE